MPCNNFVSSTLCQAIRPLWDLLAIDTQQNIVEHMPVVEHIPVIEHISIIEHISVLETRETREKNRTRIFRVGSGQVSIKKFSGFSCHALEKPETSGRGGVHIFSGFCTLQYQIRALICKWRKKQLNQLTIKKTTPNCQIRPLKLYESFKN